MAACSDLESLPSRAAFMRPFVLGMRDFSLKSPMDVTLVRSRPLFEEGVSALLKFGLARLVSRPTMFVLCIDRSAHNCRAKYRARACDIGQLSRQPVALYRCSTDAKRNAAERQYAMAGRV
jgi:hypothetical protein